MKTITKTGSIFIDLEAQMKKSGIINGVQLNPECHSVTAETTECSNFVPKFSDGPASWAIDPALFTIDCQK